MMAGNRFMNATYENDEWRINDILEKLIKVQLDVHENTEIFIKDFSNTNEYY